MKKLKKTFLILLTVIYIVTFFPSTTKAFIPSDVSIVKDSKRISTLPNNFRKTTDINELTKLKSLDLTGIDKLNISGSEQFSSMNLPLIKDEIDDKFSIIAVDLREESHGFINGIPISFENEHNNANKGFSLNDITIIEKKNLDSIKLNTPLTLHNGKVIIPKKVETELQLTKDNNISYIRIPVTDGGLPTDDMGELLSTYRSGSFLVNIPNGTSLPKLIR